MDGRQKELMDPVWTHVFAYGNLASLQEPAGSRIIIAIARMELIIF